MSERDDSLDLEELRQEACAWVLRIQSVDATTADTAELLRWRSRSPAHAKALGEAVRLRRLILEAGQAVRAAAPLLPSPAQAPQTVATTLPSAIRPAIGRRAFLGGALAASAAGVLVVRPPMGLWPSLAELRSDYRTGVGETRTIALAKGVSVELNTRTSIALSPHDQRDELKLIAGEVAVDAADARKPVAIRTHAGVVLARAGRFGVRLSENGACVTCLAGRVAVTTVSDRTIALSPGQQLSFFGETVGPVVAVDPARVEAWRRGQLIFVDEPLSHVVEELNRYRPGLIVLANSNLRDFPVNAVYQLDRLGGVVSQISQVSNAHATTLPGGVVILS